MIRLAWWACLWPALGLALCADLARAQPDDDADPLAEVVALAQQRVVKLYGASLGREKAYASGVLVSADGKIVTALSILLEGRSVRVVLPDGRSLAAQVLSRDERRQLALLKVDAEGLPFFELDSSRERAPSRDLDPNRDRQEAETSRGLEPGDWLIAAANPFKVAEGPEPASVSIGAFCGRTNLSARYRARDYPYDGPVLLTDIVVTTPGSAGGALVDARGKLVGVIGRAVISTHTNTWVNCALPVEEVAAFVAGEAAPLAERPAAISEGVALAPSVGIHLFDVGGRVRPAYVERVRPDSPAWKAGLRPNDLIVSLAGQPVATCADFERLLRQHAAAGARPPAGERLAIVVKRGQELVALELSWEQPRK
jgi:S1-C subfamily serine protease